MLVTLSNRNPFDDWTYGSLQWNIMTRVHAGSSVDVDEAKITGKSTMKMTANQLVTKYIFMCSD